MENSYIIIEFDQSTYISSHNFTGYLFYIKTLGIDINDFESIFGIDLKKYYRYDDKIDFENIVKLINDIIVQNKYYVVSISENQHTIKYHFVRTLYKFPKD